MEEHKTERLISDAFAGGAHLTRELRLSADEAGYIAAQMDAKVEQMDTSGDKTWYKVTFKQGE